MAAGQLGHMVSQGPDLNMGIGRRATDGRTAHDRQIGPVVTHGRRLRPCQAQRLKGLLGRRHLVFGAVMGMRDAQGMHAGAQGHTVAPTDDHRRDARALQQLEPMTVKGVESLDGFGRGIGQIGALGGVARRQVLTEIQAAIGEHTVDIKKSHPHRLRLQQELWRDLQGRNGHRSRRRLWHQITLARMRSLVLSAPTRRAWASTTSTLVMRCCSMTAAASAASASARTVRGWRCMTSAALKARRS